MSTIILDVMKLAKPIMYSYKTGERYDPEDSEYQRLLRDNGEKESALEKCFWAVKIMNAGGCTMLDPHPTFESTMEWISKNLFQDNVYISEKIYQNIEEIEKHIGRPIPYTKIYELKNKYPWANENQMLEIVFGLKKGIDVSIYAKPTFNSYQMSEILSGLQKGIDVSAYDKPEFSWGQMEQIRLGLEDGLDVSQYANPQLSYEEMKKIRIDLFFDKKKNELINSSKKPKKISHVWQMRAYYTTSEVSLKTGYTPTRIRRMCRAGKLIAIKKSFGWMIPDEEVKKIQNKAKMEV